MKASEIERIRSEAIERGRKERREQGIPEKNNAPITTARLSSLLKSGG